MIFSKVGTLCSLGGRHIMIVGLAFDQSIFKRHEDHRHSQGYYFQVKFCFEESEKIEHLKTILKTLQNKGGAALPWPQAISTNPSGKKAQATKDPGIR